MEPLGRRGRERLKKLTPCERVVWRVCHYLVRRCEYIKWKLMHKGRTI